MSLIGFRRQEGEIEYLEEVEYSEEHLEDDLHEVIHSDPRLVMGTLTTRENVVLGSKLQLPTGKEPDLLVCDKRGRSRRSNSSATDLHAQPSPSSSTTRPAGTAGSGRVFDLTDYESLEELYGAFEHEEDSEFDINDFEREFAEGWSRPSSCWSHTRSPTTFAG